MNVFSCHIPVDLRFGPGSLELLGKVKLPGKKALVVMSAGKSLKANGTVDRLTALLKKNGADSVLFDKVQPNPTLSGVRAGAEAARENGCDFVVGLGGGSPIDSAKAIAVAAANPGDYWDYIGAGSGGGKTPERALPIVAIPTTAGTGTEADPWTVVTKEETNEKIGSGWNSTFPTLAIVDPELMLTIPPDLTAYQGFDAFFHSAEGFINKIANPISDMFAEKSLRLLYRRLPGAVKDGGDIDARTDVALASTLAGMVETVSGCTSEHSLEHAMSAYHPELPHGAGLIMISNAYFAHFAKKVPERVAEMAGAMLELPGAKASDFLDALKKLQEDCGVAGLKMSDYGITREELPKLVKNARDYMGGLFKVDPAPLSDEEALAIFEESYR